MEHRKGPVLVDHIYQKTSIQADIIDYYKTEYQEKYKNYIPSHIQQVLTDIILFQDCIETTSKQGQKDVSHKLLQALQFLETDTYFTNDIFPTYQQHKVDVETKELYTGWDMYGMYQNIHHIDKQFRKLWEHIHDTTIYTVNIKKEISEIYHRDELKDLLIDFCYCKNKNILDEQHIEKLLMNTNTRSNYISTHAYNLEDPEYGPAVHLQLRLSNTCLSIYLDENVYITRIPCTTEMGKQMVMAILNNFDCFEYNTPVHALLTAR